jgi:type I pantothenate kinase
MADSASIPAVGQTTPYVEIDRADWAALAPATPHPLLETEIVQLRGLGEPLDMTEVGEVYLPLSRSTRGHASTCTGRPPTFSASALSARRS